jgi:hypothetical protein
MDGKAVFLAVEGPQSWANTVADLRKLRHRGLPEVDWQFTLPIRVARSPHCRWHHTPLQPQPKPAQLRDRMKLKFSVSRSLLKTT